MKKLLLALCFILAYNPCYAGSEIDILLAELDKTISERPLYMKNRETEICQLKQELSTAEGLDEQYQIVGHIVNQYLSFNCDSAETYLLKKLEVAAKMDNEENLKDSRLQLCFLYSLSGLFTQALEVLNTVKYEDLATSYLRCQYCWTYIRYCENLIKYTDDSKSSIEYINKKDAYRDTLISILPEDIDMWRKEKAFQLQERGEYQKAFQMLHEIYAKHPPSNHSYAMESMGMARLYHLMDSSYQEKKHLILAAITDTKMAVKENEAILSLALLVYKEGDINRAYNYVKVALEDANYYNSRFRNTIIARVQPIIEETYLYEIKQQKNNLRLFTNLLCFFVIALIVALFLIYRQIRIVSKTKRNLRLMNEQLIGLNKRLDEANLIKEEYLGYFMSQCAVYIDKMNNYKTQINRIAKIKQINELIHLTSSSRPVDDALTELYNTFDDVFLKLYPDFIEGMNDLLKEGEKYTQKKGLNTELRILALIRLGITDTNQIAVFLRYSVQTIYNYKSKIKGKAKTDGDIFEEKIKKIGSIK